MIRECFIVFLFTSTLLTLWNVSHGIAPPHRSNHSWWHNFTFNQIKPLHAVNFSEWFFNLTHENYLHEIVFFDSVIIN